MLDALSRGDIMTFGELLHPDVEVITARGIRRGREEATEWAQKRYEHLERRYALDELRVARSSEPGTSEDTVVASVRTQYVWRDSGLVGDESPTAIELGFREGLLARWRFREDLAAGEKV